MTQRLSALLLSLFSFMAAAAGAHALQTSASSHAPAARDPQAAVSSITAAPVITTVSPTVITAGEATLFIITGHDFVTTSTVKLGTHALGITDMEADTITATLAANVVTQTAPSTLNIVVTTPGDGNSNAIPITIVPAAAARVALTPAAASVVANGTQAYTAVVYDAFNNIRAGDSVTWTPGISISFNATGALNATAQAPTIAAAYPNAVTVQVRNTPLIIQASVGLTVIPGPVTTVSLSPASAIMASGTVTQVSAVARDTYGNAVTNGSVAWTGPGTFATPSSLMTNYTAPSLTGNYIIQVAVNSVSDSAAIAVTPGPVASIIITPATVSLAAGAQRSYVASAHDAAGNVAPNTPITWTAVGAFGSFNIGTGTTSAVIYTAPTGVGNFTVRASVGAINRTGSVTVTPGPVASISLSPSSATSSPAATTNFSAVARDQYGNVIPSASFVWTTTGGTVAPTSATPNPIVYTAPNTAGSATVRASIGAISGAASVTINPGPLSTINLTPANTTLPPLGTRAYTVLGRDAFGNTIAGLPFVWTSGPGVTLNNPAVGASSASATAGIIAGTDNTVITVSVGAIRDRANVIITPGPLFRIDVSPTGATLAPGDSQVFTATGYDQYNNLITGINVNWQQASFPVNFFPGTLRDTTPTTVRFEAGNTAGAYPNAVRAVVGGVVGTANIAITSAALARIDITPASATLPVNGVQTFTAIGYDAFNNPIPNLAVGWTTSAGVLIAQGPTTATLRASGAAGTYANGIEATTGTFSDASQITLQPGAIASVRLTPNTQSLQVGASMVFQAQAFDASNNLITGVSFTWSTPGNRGSIQSSTAANATFIAGNAAGTYANALLATASGQSGGAEVTITPGPLATLSINPSNITVLAGGSTQFNATSADAFGNPIVNPAVTWSALPAAGSILPNGSFSAGSTPGAFVNAVTVSSNSVSASTNVTVSTATLSTIVISPSVTSMAAGSARVFGAIGRDQFGNDIPGLAFTWSAPEGGVIESATPYSATFRAGSGQGLFPSAVRARVGSVERVASVLITQLAVTLNATPDTLVTNGVNSASIGVLVNDSQGVSVGAGTLVTLSVSGCPGVCTLSLSNPQAEGALSVSGLTDSNGAFFALLRSTYTSVTGTLLSQIVLTATASTRSVSAQASASVPGRFEPTHLRLPLLFREYRQPVTGNQLTCSAYPVTVPGEVTQTAENANNQYWFNAPAAGAVTLSLRNFPSSGTVYVYRVGENKCPASIRLTGPLVASTLGAGNWSQRLTGLTPGAQHIVWVVINPNGLSKQVYTVRLDP